MYRPNAILNHFECKTSSHFIIEWLFSLKNKNKQKKTLLFEIRFSYTLSMSDELKSPNYIP